MIAEIDDTDDVAKERASFKRSRKVHCKNLYAVLLKMDRGKQVFYHHYWGKTDNK